MYHVEKFWMRVMNLILACCERLYHCQCLPNLCIPQNFKKHICKFNFLSVTPAVKPVSCFVEWMQQLERAKRQLNMEKKIRIAWVLTLDSILYKHWHNNLGLLGISLGGVLYLIQRWVRGGDTPFLPAFPLYTLKTGSATFQLKTHLKTVSVAVSIHMLKRLFLLPAFGLKVWL